MLVRLPNPPVVSHQLGNPTRGEGASCNFAIFPVVLDSSDGRSSEPLIDGSEFLEATSKKVSNNTYYDHITEYSTHVGYKGNPQFRIFGGEMGFRPGREGGRGVSFAIITFGQNIICHKGRVRLPKQMNFRRRSQRGGGTFSIQKFTLFFINFYIITLYFYINSGKTKFLEKNTCLG